MSSKLQTMSTFAELCCCRMALSVQVYLKMDRPDQAEKQLKVAPYLTWGGGFDSMLASVEPQDVPEQAASACCVAVLHPCQTLDWISRVARRMMLAHSLSSQWAAQANSARPMVI